jgi:hypothetical protein
MSFFRRHRRLCLLWGLLWSLIVLSASSGLCNPRGASHTHALAAREMFASSNTPQAAEKPMAAMPANCPCCHGKMGKRMKCCPVIPAGAPVAMTCMCLSAPPHGEIAATLTSQESWPPATLPAHVYTPRFSPISLASAIRRDAVLTRFVSPLEKPPCSVASLE